ncbi:hypothetical protein [Treponema pedis]|uniref:hypothetical protein n=1 Tax=Treponema pedis TaxID=409322 RepID=UPI000423D445|nr:hypothetical protein [Treponema pedis]
MSKEVDDKLMNINLFLEKHNEEYEAEVCYVFKSKWNGLVLTEQEWKSKIDDFLRKKVI